MDFNDTQEQAKFRQTCKEWLEKNATKKHRWHSGKFFCKCRFLKCC